MSDSKDTGTQPALLEELNILRSQAAQNITAQIELSSLLALGAQVSVALIQNSSLHDMLHTCADALVQHLNAAFARIWILNTDTQMLELRASSGIYPHLNGDYSRIPMGQLKVGFIAETRLPHFTNTVIGDPHVNDQEWARREGIVAFAGYPLLVNDRVIGVMALFARHPLTESVLQIMSSLANGIALGIDHKCSEEERNRLLIHAQQAHAAKLALELRNVFLSNVSHDLKNPLTSIRTTVQLLQRRLTHGRQLDPNRLLEDLAKIESQTKKMGMIIDDLLDASQLQIGQQPALVSQKLDLVELVQRVVQIQQRTLHFSQMVVEVLVPKLVISGDQIRLERVCINLLSNAIKYSPQGGTVTVTISQVEDKGKSWAKLTIRDQGIGIPANEVAHIFEPFYRASNAIDHIAGTGIGLANVSQIIEQHGGKIAVESTEKVGTTFIIHIPLMNERHPN